MVPVIHTQNRNNLSRVHSTTITGSEHRTIGSKRAWLERVTIQEEQITNSPNFDPGMLEIERPLPLLLCEPPTLVSLLLSWVNYLRFHFLFFLSSLGSPKTWEWVFTHDSTNMIFLFFFLGIQTREIGISPTNRRNASARDQNFNTRNTQIWFHRQQENLADGIKIPSRTENFSTNRRFTRTKI